MGRLVVVAGGSRSGKSAYAEQWVKEYCDEQQCCVFYVATGWVSSGEFPNEVLSNGEPSDAEFSERIAKHRQRRPQGWRTIEEPCELPQALETAPIPSDCDAVFLVDGIGTWIANLMYIKGVSTEDACRNYAERLLDVCRQKPGVVVAVVDEVGMDVVPEHKEGRIFRDLNGMVNQMLAAHAAEVYFVVCGIPVKVKG